jgi:hypothetical protein
MDWFQSRGLTPFQGKNASEYIKSVAKDIKSVTKDM